MRFLVVFVCLTILQFCCGQDIVFPTDDDSDALLSVSQPVTERKPTIKPTIKPKNKNCPENMFRYPDNDMPRDAWVCDCKARFVYFPNNDTCYEAFMQGPCPPEHYVYLAPEESVPKCVKNPCKQDGVVQYKGVCHELRATGGPCAKDMILEVNEITFQLECIGADVDGFVIIAAPQKSCPRGSRRNSLGVCKLVL